MYKTGCNVEMRVTVEMRITVLASIPVLHGMDANACTHTAIPCWTLKACTQHLPGKMHMGDPSYRLRLPVVFSCNSRSTAPCNKLLPTVSMVTGTSAGMGRLYTANSYSTTCCCISVPRAYKHAQYQKLASKQTGTSAAAEGRFPYQLAWKSCVHFRLGLVCHIAKLGTAHTLCFT